MADRAERAREQPRTCAEMITGFLQALEQQGIGGDPARLPAVLSRGARAIPLRFVASTSRSRSGAATDPRDLQAGELALGRPATRIRARSPG